MLVIRDNIAGERGGGMVVEGNFFVATSLCAALSKMILNLGAMKGGYDTNDVKRLQVHTMLTMCSMVKLGQLLLNWHGPMRTLFGLIVWYQRPIEKHGLTGPFNNANYAGSWLAAVLPFSMFFVINKSQISIKKFL